MATTRQLIVVTLFCYRGTWCKYILLKLSKCRDEQPPATRPSAGLLPAGYPAANPHHRSAQDLLGEGKEVRLQDQTAGALYKAAHLGRIEGSQGGDETVAPGGQGTAGE